jgi:hypothetical protein
VLPLALDNVAAGLMPTQAGRYRSHYRLSLGSMGGSDAVTHDWSV